MSIPQITLAVEPFESGKIVFLPMTPRTTSEKARGRVMLQLSITNNEPFPITVQTVTILFPGSAVPSETKDIKQVVGSSGTLLWWFQNPADDILFDLPGPQEIQLDFEVVELSESKSFKYKFAPHISPVSGGAYLFPAKAVDLSFGEFWSMNGCIHGLGVEGSQSFGYDMGVMGVDPETGAFESKKPGTDGTANEDIRVFGKPLYAMADGIVRHYLNVVPNNPWPLTWESQAELDAKSAEQRANFWGSFDNSTDFGGAGNHFYIQHGDEVVLYAHMQKDTLTPSFLKVGALVHAGDKLGLAGNSGASSGPHTHIHAIQGTTPEAGPLRPIVLKDSWVIDNDLIINAAQKGIWAKTNKTGISEGNSLEGDKGDIFLFPSAKQPEYPELVKYHVAENSYHALVNDFFSNGFRPVYLHSYRFMNQTFFNVIFRPVGDILWTARHGLEKSEYLDEFNLWVTEKGYRIAHLTSYKSQNKILYGVIFEKRSGPPQISFQGLTKAEHQAKFEEWTSPAMGYVPTQISVVSFLGARFYSGVYEKNIIAGGWELKTMLTTEEYKEKWNENTAANRGLVWLHTYKHMGKTNHVGLWYGAANPKGNHHLTANEFEIELKNARNDKLYLRALCGYSRELIPNYAAFWSKVNA